MTHRKSDLRRVAAAGLAFIMALSLFATAVHATDEGDEVPETTAFDLSISVKADADAASIQNAALAELKATYPGESFTDIEWGDAALNENGVLTLTAKRSSGAADATLNVTVTIVEPDTYALKPLADINATDAKNATNNALLNYVNSDLTLYAAGGAAYDNALGDTPKTGASAAKFTWAQCDAVYDALGGLTYTFTQTDANGVELARSVTVNASTNSISRVYIDYADNTVTTTAEMYWSASTGSSAKWSKCSANMKINTSWYDDTIYFKIPATKYADESNIVSLYIPPKAGKPTEKLSLTSITHSVTVENCWDFDDVEYSIDGYDWETTRGETLTFENLSSNTSYKVSVRTRYESGELLASDAVTATIKTKEPIVTSVDVDYGEEGGEAYLDAVATIAPSRSGTTLSGSLSSSNMTKFNNVLSTYVKKYDTTATLRVEHYAEDGETREIHTASMSIPMSVIRDAIEDADLTLEYRSDFGRLYLDNSDLSYYRKKSSSGTLSISIQEMTSISNTSSLKWLYTQFKSGAPVYKLSAGVSSYKDADIKWFLPYALDPGQVIDSLDVYYVDTKGNRAAVDFTYDSELGGVLFTTDESGYFVITDNGSTATNFPFVDVSPSFWAYRSISYCYNHGIFMGTSATTFDPNGEITKAQIVTLLSRMDGFDGAGAVTKTTYNDVKATDWFAPYAEWAKTEKLITGNAFNNGPMKRQEIAKMLYDFLKNNGYDVSYDSAEVDVYDDIKDCGGNRNAVLYLRSIGLMVGVSETTFGANTAVTRAQMAMLLYRMDTMLDNF